MADEGTQGVEQMSLREYGFLNTTKSVLMQQIAQRVASDRLAISVALALA